MYRLSSTKPDPLGRSGSVRNRSIVAGAWLPANAVLRNKIYFGLKPLIPRGIRMKIRSRVAQRIRKRVMDVWPIMPGSESPPEGWPGWPDGKKFAFVLTHDVEDRAGLSKCRQLMQLELGLGFRSSFNFIPEGNYNVPRELRGELTRNGFEVGIHDLKHDGRLFASQGQFKQLAGRINRYLQEWGATGFRSGFMLHKLDWLHELDIEYDASTFDTDPFEPQPEGRHTIFPFSVPRPNTNHSSLVTNHSPDPGPGYVELPYTLPQDSTLFLLLKEKTPEIWMRKLDWIADHGGMVLLDTHPDYMAFDRLNGRAGEYPSELYKEFLTYVRSRYSGAYWHALPREVAAYVKQSQSPAGPSGIRFAPSRERIGVERDNSPVLSPPLAALESRQRLHGRRAAVLLFSNYPADPRPRRAAEALAREGVVIDVICLRESEKEPRRQTINGVNVLRVPMRRHRGGKMSYVIQYTAFILTSFACLALRSLTRRYDFVHVHNMPDLLVFSALVPKALGAKVILDLHDPMPELMQTIFKLREGSFGVRLLKRFEKWSIRFADVVLTVNLACKKIYSSRSCAPEKITVVLNSPDDDIFRFQPPRSDGLNGRDPARPFVILYHGSLVRRNGFDLAVDALEIVRKRIPAARLMVCGERTPFFEEVMESARKRGLQEAVQYLGARNLNQIVEAIESCDLGIIPNQRSIFTEINTPTRIFEYLALGKPVIAPQARGIQDYFGDEELIFFKLGDAGDLARQIEFAFFHPHDVEQIVKRGQEIYLAHTWSREKLNLLKPISELL
jgi:glycosyltransferase involved in cell wall biosynthesis